MGLRRSAGHALKLWNVVVNRRLLEVGRLRDPCGSTWSSTREHENSQFFFFIQPQILKSKDMVLDLPSQKPMKTNNKQDELRKVLKTDVWYMAFVFYSSLLRSG